MLRFNSFNASVSSRAMFAAKAEGEPEKAEKGQAAVYLQGDETIKSVVLYAENAATATLSLCAAMVVHLAARVYTPVLRDRVKLEDVKTEILGAIREHGKAARGKEFGRAWSYRILSLALSFGRSLMTDYDRKGIVEGSPLHDVLRSKTVETGVETVLDYMRKRTKTIGTNDLKTLEKALEPKKAAATPGKAKAKGKGKGKGAGSNASKPATAAATAKTLMGDHAEEVFQAVPAKSAKQRAEKLADKVGAANNVDHAAFVLRSLTFITDPEKLLAIADKATELAKAIHAASEAPQGEVKAQAAG